MKCKHCGQRIVLTGIGWRHSPRSRWPQERLCKWCRDPRLAGRRTAEPDTGISKAVFDRDIAPTLDQYAETACETPGDAASDLAADGEATS